MAKVGSSNSGRVEREHYIIVQFVSTLAKGNSRRGEKVGFHVCITVMSSAWEVRFSNSRKLPYFYNPETHASMWELPEGITEEQARTLPGGHLLGEASQDARPAAQVRASHLLVKHRESRRPSSWREVC